MNLVIYTDDEIIFNPDTIYRDGKTIKAKKNLDYYHLCEFKNDDKAKECFISFKNAMHDKLKDTDTLNIKFE